MQMVRIFIKTSTKKALEAELGKAHRSGDLPWVKRLMAILAIADDHSVSSIASILQVCERTVLRWVEAFLMDGPAGLRSKKRPGRKSKLTKSQKKELARIIEDGPAAGGFRAGCWRTPMIQTLIFKKFGVFYSVNYISELLKSMGFTYQKAAFTAARRDPAEREKWLKTTWSQILNLAREKDCLVLFGDECSFPQWGSLSYTWARRGRQPVVPTSGNRRAYKVFGLIDYFTGQFFSQGTEGRLNSDSYASFLKRVMKMTEKHIILIHDRARYHTSKAMRLFYEKNAARLTVFELPAYSPDFNPIERLWKKVKEKETHLHYFPTFTALKKKVNTALVQFRNLQDEILSLFGLYDRMSENKDDGFSVKFDIELKVKIL